jgi:cytochrome oxidase Cu insertion factor (SCO1/SenC/PrrC family)
MPVTSDPIAADPIAAAPIAHEPMTRAQISARRRSRGVLLLIAALFAAPFVAALCMYYADWQPTRTKNYGVLIHPVHDLRAVRFTRADGSRFEWHHQDHIWSVLVAPPGDCGAPCDQLADKLRRIWVGMGNKADGVRVLWVGTAPKQVFRTLIPVSADASFAAQLPETAHADSIPVYVVDPTGYVILRYAPGFNPRDLRRDLTQLLGGSGE